jgi:pimeloyl-ACP methyl ester carboxylesterase
MARIVLVHGAFHELAGPNALLSRWLPALRDGLWHHSVELDASDVGICFYGDLFRFDPAVDDPVRLDSARQDVRDAFAALAGEHGLDALGDTVARNVLARTVDMLAIIGQRPHLEAEVRARFGRVVGPETRLVIGHSLGSVVSYLALVRHPEWAVPNLVTLGSPLATDTVFPTLGTVGPDGYGRWPQALERWVNVAAHDDPVVDGTRLADRFGPRVEDRIVDNGHRPHDPEPYLNAAATGAAIAAALAG